MKEARDQFARVDASGVPARAFVDYLDAVAAVEGAKAYKRRSYELLRVRSGDRVIDVGCGVGDDARAIAERVGDHGRVVGIDLSENLVAEARTRSGSVRQVEFVAGDVHALRLSAASVDAARIDRTLQHVEDPQRAMDELVRVVRSGGRVVACEPDWDTLTIDSDDVEITRAVMRTIADDIRNPWIGRRLFAMFRARGLVELSVEGFIGVAFDYEFADAILGLGPGAAATREKGVITSDEAQRWLADLRARSAAATFFGSLSVFVVAGTKP